MSELQTSLAVTYSAKKKIADTYTWYSQNEPKVFVTEIIWNPKKPKVPRNHSAVVFSPGHEVRWTAGTSVAPCPWVRRSAVSVRKGRKAYLKKMSVDLNMLSCWPCCTVFSTWTDRSSPIDVQVLMDYSARWRLKHGQKPSGVVKVVKNNWVNWRYTLYIITLLYVTVYAS